MSEAALGEDAPLVQSLLAAWSGHRDAILQAPPGAGKSTLVPLALLAAPWRADRRILLLEPRRVAARAIAARMASLRGEAVGATIGYRMRLDTRVSAATRIEVITEGVLTRMLQDDPALEGVACVIFDEFHERSLQADLGLALCLNGRAQLGSDLRVLLMSATLEAPRMSALLPQAAWIEVPARQYPITVHYLGRAAPLLPAPGIYPERAVALAVERALGDTEGDLLVFLPGAGEIRRVQQALKDSTWLGRAQVLALYGQMPADAQDAVLRPATDGARRVVLATNVAETSVTIPGVRVVIDAGLQRRARFDPSTGMSRLELMRISRASADQRAGRAGRTAPGVCYRLWSEGAHASLAAHTSAEMLEADLAPLALELASWGVRDAAELSWLDVPPAAPLAQARALLVRLEALAPDGRISALGRAMSALPLHPRLAHMLLRAHQAADGALAAELAALLSERDLMRRGAAESDPDLCTRLEWLHGVSVPATIERAALQRIRAQAEQLRRLAQRVSLPPGAALSALRGEPGAWLALAFPDRIGQRRAGAEGRYLLSNGRGAAFRGRPALARSAYLVALELDDQEREARIDLAAPLQREAIELAFADQIQQEDTVLWDARAQAVLARGQRRLGALVLEDTALGTVDPKRAVAAMLEGVRALGLAALPWDSPTRGLCARLQFVRALGRADTADWPAGDNAALEASLDGWLGPWLAGITRREHLARVDLLQALRARLTHAQARQLEALAPLTLQVPSGSNIRIDYEDPSAPCIEVRLQEVFGLARTPLIGGGLVPITFKLLSPARRPVQITRDLAGFWRSSYVEVRKEMRGRYPRHYWPEDPQQAEPSRQTRRRP